MPIPTRVVEKPARQRYEICLITGNDRFRLVRLTNRPWRVASRCIDLRLSAAQMSLRPTIRLTI
jgi:hypothetical protein